MVVHAQPNFVEGMEALAAYLRTMNMELNVRKCAMANKNAVPGFHLQLCCDVANTGHSVAGADSVPYLRLRQKPEEEFTLQYKHRLRLAAVHHCCRNTLAPPKLIQDVLWRSRAG